MQECVNDIPNILNATIQRLKRTHQAQSFEEIRIAEQTDQQQWLANLNLEQDAENILEVLLGKQFNPASINTNVFPLLKLPQDLQQVIREQGLESTKAKELAKLSAATLNMDEDAASKIRSAVAHRVIEEARSRSKTRDFVKELINKHIIKSHQPLLNPQLEKTRRQIQSIKFDGISSVNEIKELKKILRDKLRELDQI